MSLQELQAALERRKTVEAHVETWRIKLGFKPWDEFAREAATLAVEHKLEVGRRCGKTAHALLNALALAVTRGEHVIYFGDPANANTAYCINMAREFIVKLGLDLTVERDSRGGRGRRAIVYYDHWEPRDDRPRRRCTECGKPGHRPEDHAGWEPPK